MMNVSALSGWPARLWPAVRKHWPLGLGTLGAVWLVISLLVWSPTTWIQSVQNRKARLEEIDQKIYQLTANRSLNNKINPETGRKDNVAFLTGRKAEVWTGGVIKLGLCVFLPFLFVLIATGYYLYWHFVRQTLFNPDWRSQLVFIVVCLAVWWCWKAAGSLGVVISSSTAKAGIDGWLPSLTMSVWLTQFVVMHVLIRQREDRELAQATREAELAALTAQVNPPFIFHALRHLQAAAYAETLPRTQQSLNQLAGLMQYVLEESRKQVTDVSREITFIGDYLKLQELRLPRRDNIQISTEIVWDGKPAPIVPLLLNPLVENAFKYGISIQQTCFVRIRVAVQEGVLMFVSENSILPRTELEKGTGLGLANVRKRLQLAYANQHRLTVTQQPDRHKVELMIKLC